MNSPIMQVFADHESSLNPIDVPRSWIWNLPRRTVYFGTSVSTIFKGKRIIIYKHLLHSYPYLSKNEAYTNKKTVYQAYQLREFNTAFGKVWNSNFNYSPYIICFGGAHLISCAYYKK